MYQKKKKGFTDKKKKKECTKEVSMEKLSGYPGLKNLHYKKRQWMIEKYMKTII